MATISITIPDQNVQRVLDAFAGLYRRPEYVPDPTSEAGGMMPNPETKAAFARRKTMDFIRDVVVDWEATQAANAAKAAAVESAQAIQYT